MIYSPNNHEESKPMKEEFALDTDDTEPEKWHHQYSNEEYKAKAMERIEGLLNTDHVKTCGTDFKKGATVYDEYLPKEPTAFETQVGGSHYKDLKIQPTEYILANNLGFLEGNVIKYVTRYKSKNGVEDIDKAIHYLQILKESLCEAN